MSTIDMIKKAGFICDDVANYVLLDFMVGDKKHWKNKFNNCMDVIKDVYNHFNDMGLVYEINYYRYLINIKGYETKSGGIKLQPFRCKWIRMEPVRRKRFITFKQRKDLLWFNSRLKSQLDEWVWERADDYYDYYNDMEYWEAEEAFKNSITYVSEFRKQFSLIKYKI
jgi:hypothetical protein